VEEPAAANLQEDKMKKRRTNGQNKDSEYYEVLCKAIRPIAKSNVTPSQGKNIPDAFDKNVDYGALESMYKVHQEKSVMLDVEKVEIYEYFRCIQKNSSEYIHLRDSFVVCMNNNVFM